MQRVTLHLSRRVRIGQARQNGSVCPALRPSDSSRRMPALPLVPAAKPSHSNYFGMPARSALIRAQIKPKKARLVLPAFPARCHCAGRTNASMFDISTLRDQCWFSIGRNQVAEPSMGGEGLFPETTSTSASSSRGRTIRRSSTSRSPSMRPSTGRGPEASRRSSAVTSPSEGDSEMP
jgi:hypothetical protein